MVSIPPRWIVVDDTSPDINYSGNSWFAQNGNPITTEDTGLPHQNTLHGTITNASLTFKFTGRAVTVKGTIQTQNVSSVDNPTWVCLLDGDQIGSDISRRPSLPTSSNSWIYCQNFRLTDGPHTLVINVTATEKPFWFDRIEYAPSASEPLENRTISVSGADDPALHFSAGWVFGQTSQRGATMTFDFIGSMLTWWTQYVAEGNSTTATWSIDDKPAQNVTLPDHKSGSKLYNQKVFDTGPLAMGPHHLAITYNGNSTNTPLVLASVFVENSTFPTRTETVLGPTSSAGSASTNRPTHSGSKVAPGVIGGVVGVASLFLIIITVFLFVFIRRRRRNSSRVRLIEKFDVAPGHPPLSAHSKPRFNFQNGDASQLTSPSAGTSPGNILFPQPMPRKVREELEYSAGGASPSTSSNGQITQPGLYQPMPRKALENMAIARGGVEHSVNREPVPPPTLPNKGRIVVHQDSGVRLNNQRPGPDAYVDTPPEYN